VFFGFPYYGDWVVYSLVQVGVGTVTLGVNLQFAQVLADGVVFKREEKTLGQAHVENHHETGERHRE
jgi:hypothetical protein